MDSMFSCLSNTAGGHIEMTDDILTVTHKQGEYGGPKGMNIRFKPKSMPCEEGTLRYKVMLPKEFDIAKGGKLPGLCGGCQCGHTGFATRLMWRRGLDGEVYCHGPKQSSLYYKQNWIYDEKYGDSLARGAYKFKTDEWNAIELYLKLNDPQHCNGTIRLTVNGSIVFNYTEYVFRECSHIKIDTILFVMFYGGSNESWAPTKESKAYFKDIDFQ